MIMRCFLALAVGLGSLAQAAPGAAVPAAESPQLSLQPFARIDLTRMEDFRRELALRLIDHLRDPSFRALLESRLGPGTTRIRLAPLVRDWAELWPSPMRRRAAALLADLDLDARQRMGLDGAIGSLLGLELVWPLEGPRRLDWNQVLFAIRPRRSAQPPAAVEAYDSLGQPHPLDPAQAPGVPVLLAGIDRPAAVRAGIQLVNRGLAAAGCAAAPALPPAVPVDCTKLAGIRLARSRESWWEAGLEIYALVSGIDPGQPRPAIRLVNLPYLSHSATDYFPNQVLLFWSDYRFSAANIQFWQHGDGIDYKAILDAVLKGAGAAMAAGGLLSLAWIPALADAIVQAMPSSWLVDPDTLVDTFYTVEKGEACSDRPGVRGVARISLAPWVLKPQ